MNTLAHSLASWIALIIGLDLVYILSSVLAVIRPIKHLGVIIGLSFVRHHGPPPCWRLMLACYLARNCGWPPSCGPAL